MKKVILGLCLIAATATMAQAALAQAATLKGGYGACVTEELFSEMVSAAVADDQRALEYLLDNGCLIPRAGINITLLDTTWTGTAKVKAYVGDNSIVLWTNRENVQR